VRQSTWVITYPQDHAETEEERRDALRTVCNLMMSSANEHIRNRMEGEKAGEGGDGLGVSEMG
jgi:hypothetical protein